MKAFILLLICLNFIIQTNQLDCSTYSDSYCGGYNVDIALKCHDFGSGAGCEEVEVDEGCEINSEHQCVGISISNDEKCVQNGSKKCKKESKLCSDYSDSDCGGLKITEHTQCIQLTDGAQCTEFYVDKYCQISTENLQCTKRAAYQSNSNIICEQTDFICQRKTCKNQSPDTCNSVDNCYKVFNGYGVYCSEVEINDKCLVNADGQCEDNGSKATEKCDFNEDFTKCMPRQRLCEEYDICSDFVSTNNNKVCISSGGGCKLIDIDSSCKIGEDGTCQLKSESNNKVCDFNEDKTKCQLINIDILCGINNKGECYKKDPHTTTNKKCKFNEAHDKCQSVDKECEEIDADTCDSVSKGYSKKCSLNSGLYCQEYTYDEYCIVNGGICQKKDDITLGQNEICLFDLSGKTCKKKKNICSNYYASSDCQSFEITSTTQCLFNSDGYCKEIKVDEYCKVVYNNKDEDLCTKRDDVSFDEKDGICAYDDDEKKTSCTRRARKCTEYTNNDCQSLNNCFFYNSKCYESDNYCIINSDGNCVKKEGVNLSNKEKCYKDEFNQKCSKVEKNCNDFESANCADFEKTQQKQCFNINHGSYCDTVELDGNCYVNEHGECVSLSSVKLTVNEICAFNAEESTCKKREKQCSDIKDNTCGIYTPLSKLCFKFEEFDTCKEVKVDSGCEISDENECTGKNCSFDKDKNKCAKKDGSSSLLKFNSFMILILFFIF